MAFINNITPIQFEFDAIGLRKLECERVGIRSPPIVTGLGKGAAGIIDCDGIVAVGSGSPIDYETVLEASMSGSKHTMVKNLIGGEQVQGPRVSRNFHPSDTCDLVGECAR